MIRLSPRLAAASLLLLVASPALGQSLWSRVPVLPKACYANDTFDTDVEALRTELLATIAKQKATNEELTRKTEALDPGTQQARMMAFLTKDPVAAQKHLQEMTDPQHGTVLQTIIKKREALKQRLAAIQAEYEAEAEPMSALMGTISGESNRNRTVNEARAAAVQYNALYEKLCVKWFTSATSPYLPWLAELKRHLIEESIPWHVEEARRTKSQLDLMGIPSAAFKATGELQAVTDYLDEAGKIFNGRAARPMVTG